MWSNNPGTTPGAPKLRDPLADHLKAVNDQIADRASVGVSATPYLLQQKRELEAKLGIAPEVKPEVRPVEALLERKDVESAPEVVVPRRPGRPRKIDVAPAGS